MYKALALFALLSLSSQSVLAADTTTRQFPLPDHGALVIAVPNAWQDAVAQPPDRLPPTLKFSAKDAPPFEVLVTPLWAMGDKAPPLDSASIRKEVESAAEDAKPQAVEKLLAVETLKGADGVGYYFSATDRAPNPGEFKHLTQGILPVGDLVVSFTILTNDGQASTVEDALRLVQSIARQDVGAVR